MGHKYINEFIAGSNISLRKYRNQLTIGVEDAFNTDPWVDVRAYASINAAVAAIGATQTTLVVPNAQTLTASLTIPSNIHLIPLKGGSIAKAPGCTLTINGSFEAGPYQVFSGFSAGDVTFGSGSVKEVIPQWWGADSIAGDCAYSSISSLTEPITVFDKTFPQFDHDLFDFPFERLIHSRQRQGIFRAAKYWTGAAGENNALSVTTDGYYLYVAFGLSPAKIVKIDPLTMTTVASWTGAAGQNEPHEVKIDGYYLYVTLRLDDITPGKVVKIDSKTMTTVAVWTGAAGQFTPKHMTFDGSYLYVSLYLDPAQVVKINPTTMTTVATWTGDTANFPNQHYPQLLVFDGTYIYVGFDGVPAMTVRINPSTMTMAGTVLAYNKFYDSDIDMYGGNYIQVGQRINIEAGTTISRVDFLLDKVGSPTGTATVVARDTAGVLIGTFGTIDVSTITTDPLWYHFTNPVTFSSTADYRILIEYNGGDAANYLAPRSDNSDRTTGQLTFYSVAGGWIDNTGDSSIKLFTDPISFWEAQIGVSGGGIFWDGSYLYSPKYDTPWNCFKIDPNKMITVKTWNPPSGIDLCSYMLSDEKGYLYMMTNQSPGRIYKIKSEDMSTVSTYIGASGKNVFYQGTIDRYFVYVTTNASPSQVIRKIIGNVDETGI